MENINHKNFFVKEEKTEEVVEEATVEPEELVIEKEVEDALDMAEDFYKLNKKEQVDKLKEFGISTKKIKELTYEEDRVKKLVELSRD